MTEPTPAGGEAEIEFPWPDNFSGETHNFKITADHGMIEDETNEGNNVEQDL
jgi:hypothetical protein